MIEIKGFSGYYLADDGKNIIGKRGMPLKPINNCVVLQQNRKRTVVPVNKLIFCAQNNVSPVDIPKGYSFRDKGEGVIEAETFGQRMSFVIKKRMNKVKISDEEIEYLLKYFQLMRDVFHNNDKANAQLYLHIYSDRNKYVLYAFNVGNNLTKEKAEMYADDAILKIMENICKEHLMIMNPRGYVRSCIRDYIKKSRTETREHSPNIKQTKNI